jgi:hypothetical protein
MHTKWKRWTPEEIEEIRAARQEHGRNREIIARRFKITSYMVVYLSTRHKLHTSKSAKPFDWTEENLNKLITLRDDPTLTSLAIADKMQASLGQIDRAVQKYKLPSKKRPFACGSTTPWPKEKEIALKKIIDEENLSARAIGQRLGTTKNAIIGKLYRLSLTEPTSTFDQRMTALEGLLGD